MAELPQGAAGTAHRAHSESDRRQGASLGKQASTVANVAGAIVSLALILGVGIWGYRLLVRDVSGVPVVRAAEGPMRITPEDPGGQLAEHLGFAVNRVAGTGEAEPPADRLVLAPRPVQLTEEDVPLATGPAIVPVAAPPSQSDAPQDPVSAALPEPAPRGDPGQVASDDQMARVQALADAIAAEAAPLSDLPDDPEPETARALDPVAAVAAEPARPVPEGALARSLRPQTRPEGLKLASVAPARVPGTAPAAAGAAQPGLDVDPDTLPPGTRLVQLGAYDSAETARAEWGRLAGRFDAYLDGKKRVIQRAKSGGRVFYRLRAMGFEDLSDARRFCSALVAEQAECIPVTTR